jgi:HPt (histidine-containing phosphotransfer) domain-containing protein
MIEKRDLLAVKNAFHRLKGSAINCGLNKLHDLAKDAEEEAEGENWRAVSMFYDKIKVEFDAIQQEISTEFKLES